MAVTRVPAMGGRLDEARRKVAEEHIAGAQPEFSVGNRGRADDDEYVLRVSHIVNACIE